MALIKKPVAYRLNGGACQRGYINIADCDDTAIYDWVTNLPVPGAVVVPLGDCPEEVVVIDAIESDPVIFCDNGTTFVRWFIKTDGIVTSTTDTTIDGTAYTPVGPITLGACAATLIQQDREMQVLCAPDGTKVIVQNVTPDDAPLGTAPTIEAWLLDGTPYAGLLADLGTCGGEQVDVSAVQWFCAAGQSISRTDFWDVFSTPRALLGSIWQDASGAVVAAPAVGTFTVGECSTCPVLVPQGVISNWG